ncbi:GGDEF domain-containing protein [Ferriphaselus sp. R-1]|uniref:GGDEF domain-containing protein n=1 Tax=Ferriphaselus sp. R-1 TaxID=1485544 RepID=UPI001268ED2D|nr:GGDEF domain-containing protein [Ferriphaselus sp. R-1]
MVADLYAQLHRYAEDINQLMLQRNQLIASNSAQLEAAMRDPLTGLLNRRLLDARIDQAILNDLRRPSGFALFYIDLDKLKPINDRYGHAVGDAALKLQSERMVNAVRKVDSVARVGGDEFIIVTEGLADTKEIAVVANKLLVALSQPIGLGEHSLKMGASIGVVRFPMDATCAAELYRLADQMMYAVKHSGGGRFRIAGVDGVSAHLLEIERPGSGES